ncbi:MAG: type II toxin-antitoxin system prevent-host-death family antitoxin [Gammaproteobacteria bacterium]|nr:type II toxin-antitoxin system prevent-host-death family antitoxin [Gammaproteobacteria bacterium]MCY4166145.1 type II toxin-antitoxin system prevent-host-death family antitoxin [Gammaproteobacteria bacterium]
MTRHIKIGEAKTHLSALLAKVEAGEDLIICRGETPVAHVTRIDKAREHAELCETLRRERAKQRAVTTCEILSWRHEGHSR